MSLSAYQRELAAMVADPSRRRAIAGDDGALAGAPLTRRERARLLAFSRDPGMAVNTILYRANRLSPIYNVLPRTCDALGDALGALVHAYWSSRAIEDLQWASEAARFAAFLRREAAHVLMASPGLSSLLAYELARYELAMLPCRAIRARVAAPGDRGVLHPLVRVIRFEDDGVLLDWREAAGRETRVAPDLADSLAAFTHPQRANHPAWPAALGLGLLVSAGDRARPRRR